MKKKILVINGHSVKDSFCEGLAKSYIQGAKKGGADVRSINLYDVDFKPVLSSKKNQVLEKDLKNIQKDIKWADHLVFVYPIWWGDMPALMKGFFDRVFTPGFAYDPKNKKLGLPRGLLTGKSARAIITMGAPTYVYRYVFRKPATRILKYSLNYCGIKNIKVNHFGGIDSSSTEQRKNLIEKVRDVGELMQ